MKDSKKIYLIISKNFKRIRKDMIHLTQQKLAEEMNMSRDFISHFEATDGTIGISIDTLFLIAQKYHFDIREFFIGYEDLIEKKS